MKKRLISMLGLLLVGFLLTACSQANDRYQESMNKGKDAIYEKKFDVALKHFDTALKEKNEDTVAKEYKTQLKTYIKGLDFQKQKKYDQAIDSYDLVIKQKVGFDKLVSYAKENKKEVEKLLSKETPPQETEETSDSEEVTTELWNSKKGAALSDFMTTWGASMDQAYQEYAPNHNVDYYGVAMPDTILSGEWTMVINDQPIALEWSETGQGNSSHQVVAVYSDADTQPYLKQHVYFFMLVNGQPKVYVTQQNQGNDEKYFYFNETENVALKEGFHQIVQSASNPSVFNKQINNAQEAIAAILKHTTEDWLIQLNDFNGSTYELESVGRRGGHLFFKVTTDGVVTVSETRSDGQIIYEPIEGKFE